MKYALFHTNQVDSFLPLRRKFKLLEKTNVHQLKLRPVIDETDT